VARRRTETYYNRGRRAVIAIKTSRADALPGLHAYPFGKSKTGRLIAVASYGEYRAPLAVGGIIDAWLDSADTPIG